MQAKIYAPTVEQRQEALRVAERFWTRALFIRLAIYSAVPLALAWYEADFAVPFALERRDVVIGLMTAIIGEIWAFADKKSRANDQFEDTKEIATTLGPLQYRVTETGVDFWATGVHHHDAWEKFKRFKLTDELLVLIYAGRQEDYWVFSRREIGEPLLAEVLRNLEANGVIRVSRR